MRRRHKDYYDDEDFYHDDYEDNYATTWGKRIAVLLVAGCFIALIIAIIYAIKFFFPV